VRVVPRQIKLSQTSAVLSVIVLKLIVRSNVAVLSHPDAFVVL
jgi:hypothetical protein